MRAAVRADARRRTTQRGNDAPITEPLRDSDAAQRRAATSPRRAGAAAASQESRASSSGERARPPTTPSRHESSGRQPGVILWTFRRAADAMARLCGADDGRESVCVADSDGPRTHQHAAPLHLIKAAPDSVLIRCCSAAAGRWFARTARSHKLKTYLCVTGSASSARPRASSRGCAMSICCVDARLLSRGPAACRVHSEGRRRTITPRGPVPPAIAVVNGPDSFSGFGFSFSTSSGFRRSGSATSS